MSAITQGLFNNTVVGFLIPTMQSGGIAWTTQGTNVMSGAYGAGNKVTLNEFWGTGSSASDPVSTQVMNNLRANWGTMAVQMVAIPFAFRIGKRLAAPAINTTNRMLRNAGIGNTIKV